MPQHPKLHRYRWLLAAPLAGALVLTGCAGGGNGSDDNSGPSGFSIMVPVSNDADDAYHRLAEKYTAETGVEIEVIDYPGDAYNAQVRTQLQAGTAADVIILAPGTGQETSVIPIAEEGFLEALDGAARDVIPAGTEHEYEVDGQVFAQPTGLTPVGFVWNGNAAAEVGITEFPETFEDMLDACVTAREGGKVFTALAGAALPNAGMLGMNLAAATVFGDDRDWNSKRHAGDVTFVGSGWEDALENIITMNDAGCFQDGAAGGGFDAITNGVVGGTALTGIVPGSAAASMNAADEGLGINAQAFPAPAGTEPVLFASANYSMALNAKASAGAKESVKEFLDWFAEPEQAVLFADYYGLVPIVGGNDDNLLEHYRPIADLLASGNYVGMPNASWPNPAVYEALASGVQGLLTGQRTPHEVAEAMDNAWG